MSQQQRAHVLSHMCSVTVWNEKNLSDKICHDCAAATAKEKFRLEPYVDLIARISAANPVASLCGVAA